MAVEVWVKRTQLGVLVPANSQSEQELKKLPVDEWRLASIRLPRNLKHHRKWMALLQAVFPHQDEWPTFKSFRRAVKKALGLGEWIESKSGHREFEEGSIAFDKMDQDEFDQFYARGVSLVITRILPAVNSEDLNAIVEEILAGRKAA